MRTRHAHLISAAGATRIDLPSARLDKVGTRIVSLSPNGDMLLVTRTKGDTGEYNFPYYCHMTAPTKLNPVFPLDRRTWSMQWSPDGTQIAYCRGQAGLIEHETSRLVTVFDTRTIQSRTVVFPPGCTPVRLAW